MAGLSGLRLVGLLIGLVLMTSAQTGNNPAAGAPQSRFEYKYSFKPPYLAQKDGTVPFFEYSGNAIASAESVRITPSLRSQKGAIWSRLITNFDWWEAEVQFRVTGRGRIGADGLAFWYTATKGFEGPVFGSSDKWVGLGVFFDSFDNDNKHNNPYIMAMTNDGTQAYDHQKDGMTQQLAGCLRDFRNKPFPVKAKIQYYMNTLTVHFHNGMSNTDKDFELCMRVENVILPKNGYFGVSAATGGLADDHDVNKFSIWSLRAAGDTASGTPPAEDPKAKELEDEYERNMEKLKEQKKKYQEEHPDEVKPDEDDWDNWFSESEKELQNIFQGQSQMKEILAQLDQKMNDILQRQDRAQQAINVISSKSAAVGQPGQASQPPSGGGGADTINRNEVNAILANQREIVTATRDIKNFVADIHSKTGQILNRGTGSAQPVGGAYDVQVSLKEMRDSLNNVRHEFSSAAQRMAQKPECPDKSCVSTTVLVGAVSVQFVLLICYFMYRDNQQTQSKKFY